MSDFGQFFDISDFNQAFDVRDFDLAYGWDIVRDTVVSQGIGQEDDESCFEDSMEIDAVESLLGISC